MRKLQSKDIFAAARLLTAIGVREELRDIAEKASKVDSINQMDVGVDFIYGLFEKAVTGDAEQKFYEFFAGIFECGAKEVEEMDPCDLIDNILEVADIKKWRDFFSKVRSLMNLK